MLLYDAAGNAYEVDDTAVGTEPHPDSGPQTNSDFAALRKQTQATKAAEAKAVAAQRESAFLRAGIDPDAKEGMAGLFAKGYDGDLTVEAIKAAALSTGLIQPPPATAAQVQGVEDLAASQRIAGAANAAQGYDQEAAQRQAMADAYASGGIEAMTAVLQGMGIPRVTL